MKDSNHICDFSDDELKVVAGSIMRDLRGDWSGSSYITRIEKLENIVKQIGSNDKTLLDDVSVVLGTCHHQKYLRSEYGTDGRYFRGLPFYDVYPEAGKTERVQLYLHRTLSYPEYSWMGPQND